MANLVGTILGRYRIVAQLGRGGMAEVYKAYQPGLDRYVAVKVMHRHLADDPDFIGRFEREAQNVAKLRHPNIVQVYEFDEDNGTYYMVMEYVEGPTLKDEIQERTQRGVSFELAEIVRTFTALCNAIDYAHRRGMIHRDLKPANVMLTKDGQVILTDFGIARMVEGTKYTMTGALTGTPAYMSPEQGEGKRGDERSDIYSIGVMLYQMTTGRVPYEADTPFAIIMKHINEPLPLPTTVNPNLPPELEAVILKALAKDADDRFPSGAAMAGAIRDAAKLPFEEIQPSLPISTLAGAPLIRDELSKDDQTFTRAAQPEEETAPATATRTVLASVGSNRGLQIAIGAIVLIFILGVFGVGFLISRSGGEPTAAPATISAAEATAIAEQTADALAQAAVARIEATQDTQRTATAAAAAAAGIDTPTPLPPTATNTPYLEATSAKQTVEAVAATQAAQAALADFFATQTAQAPPPTDTSQPTATPTVTNTPQPTNTPTVGPTNTPRPPTSTPAPAGPNLASLGGRIAIPIDDGGARYDMVIFSVPEGKELGRIIGARQPDFRPDGKLLVNGEVGPVGGGIGNNVYMYDSNGSNPVSISGSPNDGYATWSPDGGRITYDNPQLVLAKDVGPQEWHIFVQPGLSPPDIGELAGFHVIAGDIFEGGQPLYPLWADDDFIIFRACNYWQPGGGGQCAVWRTPSWATVAGDGFLRPALVANLNGIPTDTGGTTLLLMSQVSGNWEVYRTTITGGEPVNLTNSPTQDGLGTLSPDGQWVAFVSDRGGGWAVWVVPVGGGQASKLFGLPPAPWGAGERDWTRERISWGP